MIQRITESSWPEHWQAIAKLRRAVFIEEQHVPDDLEWDELDASARHFCIWQGEALVAYARLVAQPHAKAKLTRMAVAKDFRRQGLGRCLVQHIVKWARHAGLHKVELDAQVQALGFYQRQDFALSGELFLDAGIEHRHMELELMPAGNIDQ
jgi:predicted GNAT family N-acyltransferase